MNNFGPLFRVWDKRGAEKQPASSSELTRPNHQELRVWETTSRNTAFEFCILTVGI